MLTTFAGTLSSPVTVGHIFHLCVKSLDDAERVDINFQAEKSIDGDIPLQLSLRFEEKRMVWKAKLAGRWVQDAEQLNTEESRTALQSLNAGHTFSIFVLVGDEKYHIALANTHIGSFAIKGKLSDIKVVTITQDVHQVLAVDHRQSFPFPFPAIQVSDDTTYFSNDVPKPFLPGHVTILTAVPYGNPRGGFIIKFHENGSKKQALHFNPRFDPHYVVVRNSHATEALDFRQEERSGGFPFIIDQQFKLAIGFTEQEFKFAINGSHFEAYTYKTPRLLDVLNGFRIQCTNGLQLEVTAVDHHYSGTSDCTGYEQFSDPYADVFE
ncbi:32 kDa beta-galactoside-binding lectin lec-3-like [Anopheles bellator]|uniref:32 kDa beta-galactoside-binding lectin lec-3-like n=1 Tax=Anopheles bellator TaxID=139047 RepID=UPI002649E8D8|nr:32 kDa beta-galactoside-binding lectin lec-3-like [Anopheles bellator]